MNNVARRHHYIPQFYLRGFSDPTLQNEQLHVIDKVERRYFVNIPRNVGFQTDFNRVNVPEKPIDTVEKLFAKIEREVAQVLMYVKKNKTLPENTDDMQTLIYFVALLYMHNPQIRNNLENIETTIIKQFTKALFFSPERYESYRQQQKAAGKELSDYETMKQFSESEDYDIKYGHGHQLRYELESINNSVFPLLVQRKWILLIAEDGTSDFVCSDRPVALISIGDPPENPYHPYNIGVPGLVQKNTQLTLPLNRRMALIATFENESCIPAADEKIVAEINARTIHFATRQIYCSNLDFKFLENSVMKSGRDLFDERDRSSET